MGAFAFIPPQASTIAGKVDILFIFMTALMLFFTLLVATLIIYFGIKYRRRSDDEVPPQITGSIRMEMSWIVGMLVLGLITFFWSAWLYVDIYRPPTDALEIHVMGKMWMWKFQHPDGQQEINELHVPVGRPVKLLMTSQDVIHSFFVPDFRVKHDVLPERYTEAWFEATETGTFHLFCTEYCGSYHSRMIGSVVVMDEGAYQDWLAGGQAQGSPAEMGEQLFQNLGCAGCHREDGNGPGPSLVGIFNQEVELASGDTVVADETYLRESILEPNAEIVAGFQPIMPTFEGQVSEEQLIQLITYIKSLGPQQEGGGEEGSAPGASPMGTPSSGATPVPQTGE